MKGPKARIDQIVACFSRHDAIGNETLLIQKHLRDQGFKSDIFFEEAGDRRSSKSWLDLETGPRGSLAYLVHFSIATTTLPRLSLAHGMKLVRYHNITPPEYFDAIDDREAAVGCARGRRQIPSLASLADGILAASRFSAEEMAPYGRSQPAVGPVWRDYEALLKAGPSDLPQRLGMGADRQDLLYIGRLSPNKAQQDLIRLTRLAIASGLDAARIILVGGTYSPDFKDALIAYANNLGLGVATSPTKDPGARVVFLTQVDDRDVASLYRSAQVFVSMSEHEGFGVPLVEAMHFDLPVLAHRAAAVPETIGAGGLVVDKQDWVGTVRALHALVKDAGCRAAVIDAARLRRRQLDLPNARSAFDAWLGPLVAKAGGMPT